MTPEDGDLIRQAQRGAVAAFEQLVYRHDRQVLGIVARYVTNAEDAKDIYQEVFLRAYRGLKHFRFRSEFSTWLHRITANVCMSHRSREKKRLHVPLPTMQEGEQESNGREPESTDRLPDQVTADAEIALHVEHALAGLSPQQRLVFTLRHYQGYKIREIAGMMDCTEGTVKRYLFAATRRMRDMLREVLTEPSR